MADPDRRERLQALRAAAAAADEEQAGGGGAAPSPAAGAAAGAADEPPVLRFRNYVVKDQAGIAHVDVAPPRVAPIDTVLKEGRGGAGTAAAAGGGGGSSALAPPVPPEQLDAEALLAGAARSANADLKREIAPRLARLERRTARAMLQIMREEERARHVTAGGAAAD